MAERGVNKVILIGRLGADPELRYTQSNVAVTSLSLGTRKNWKDQQSGELKSHTEWHRLVAYRRLAEVCSEYLGKGDKIYIEGHLATRKYKDRNDIDRYVTEVVIDEMEMLDTKGGRNSQHAPGQSAMPEPYVPTENDFDDDKIPF